MLRSEFPFKISIASSPNELAETFLLNFIESESSDDLTPPSYEKTMDINNISIRLHIKHLRLRNQFTAFRLKDFQGSIGMIYIFDKSNIDFFNNVTTDYTVFKNFYKTVEIQPVFVGVGGEQKSEIMIQIHQKLVDLKLKQHEFEQIDDSSFLGFVHSLITNSKSFQSTTQGSCDVNFE